MVVECSMMAALISGDILQALWEINIDKKKGGSDIWQISNLVSI